MSNARAVIRDIDRRAAAVAHAYRTWRSDIDRRAAAVAHAYRTWRSPKTAAKRHAAREQRIAVERANIKAKEELAKARQ